MQQRRFLSFVGLLLILSACSSQAQPEVVDQTLSRPTVPVKTRSLSELAIRERGLEYPGVVVSGSEVRVISKSAGTVSELSFEVGDTVRSGQTLVRLDVGESSVTKTNYQNALQARDNMQRNITNTAQVSDEQIRQASLAVEQARQSFELARKNYDNLQNSAEKDMRSSEIAAEQARSGRDNLGKTTDESLKSAQLGYDTAKVATEGARISLENRKKDFEKASGDLQENIKIATDGAITLAGALLDGVNAMTGFDDKNLVNISYRDNLGALKQSTYESAEEAYEEAKRFYNQVKNETFSGPSSRLQSILELLSKIKRMTDTSKDLLDNSFVSAALSLDLLSRFQTSLAGYQAQVTQMELTMNQLKQSDEKLDLDTSSVLEGLQKAYEITLQQEKSAAQAVENLKAGNTAQQDQAGYGVTLAENQVKSLSVKLQTQLDAAKAQVDLADLQYKTAQTALETARKGRTSQLDSLNSQLDAMEGQLNLAKIQLDQLTVAAPVTARVQKKEVDVGQVVNPGQSIAVLQGDDVVKVQFFVPETDLSAFSLATPLEIRNKSGIRFSGTVSAISPQADPVSRRFLIDITLDQNSGSFPVVGAVVTVLYRQAKAAADADSVYLPLEIVTVNQNESFIYVATAENAAKKYPVTVVAVEGEYALIKTDLPVATQIIVEGQKLLKDGDPVSIEQKSS